MSLVMLCSQQKDDDMPSQPWANKTGVKRLISALYRGAKRRSKEKGPVTPELGQPVKSACLTPSAEAGSSDVGTTEHRPRLDPFRCQVVQAHFFVPNATEVCCKPTVYFAVDPNPPKGDEPRAVACCAAHARMLGSVRPNVIFFPLKTGDDE